MRKTTNLGVLFILNSLVDITYNNNIKNESVDIKRTKF